MPNEGSLVLVIILIVLQGVTGISFGLVISAAIDDEQSANQAALGIFYPNLIISGTPRWSLIQPGNLIFNLPDVVNHVQACMLVDNTKI